MVCVCIYVWMLSAAYKNDRQLDYCETEWLSCDASDVEQCTTADIMVPDELQINSHLV